MFLTTHLSLTIAPFVIFNSKILRECIALMLNLVLDLYIKYIKNQLLGLMSMSNITFEVPMLSTFVLKKCSEKIHSRLNIVIRAFRVLVGMMLAQRCRWWPSITSALGQCIVLSGVSGVVLEASPA